MNRTGTYPQNMPRATNNVEKNTMTALFSREFTYPYGTLVEISENLRLLVANNPGPFTFTGTNTFIIGRGSVAILDPGPDDEAHLTSLLNALEGETLTHILISHTHKDHVGLVYKLKAATGAQTYGYATHALSAEEEMSGLRIKDNRDRSFTPDHALIHGQSLKIGGAQLEVIHTPGHTDDHLCFALKGDNVLLSGDHVMGWSTSIIAPPDGHMGDYVTALKDLLARSEQIYHPTHGSPITEPHRLVEHLIAHRMKREQAILDQLAGGPMSIPEIVREVYVGLDQNLFGAAMLSTQAHLIWLMEKKQIETITRGKDPLSEARYKIT